LPKNFLILLGDFPKQPAIGRLIFVIMVDGRGHTDAPNIVAQKIRKWR
jgi:hypothetical protein